jgi:hypothetical protein
MVPVLVADLIVNIQRDFWAMVKEFKLQYVNKKKKKKIVKERKSYSMCIRW